MTTALITGANRGLGRETARRLAALGWTVHLGARDPERGERAAAELAADGGDVRPLTIDVTSDDSVAAAAWRLEALGQPLDVLVNNAGILPPNPAGPLQTAPADFLACFGVNLLGPVRVTRALLPLLERSDHPRVVMVSSGVGSLTSTSDPARPESSVADLVFPASKAALNMVTVQYAKALPRFRVNAADPGFGSTEAQGAEVVVRLATVDRDGPTGGFFDGTGPVPW